VCWTDGVELGSDGKGLKRGVAGRCESTEKSYGK
jgi:hypothetical protein